MIQGISASIAPQMRTTHPTNLVSKIKYKSTYVDQLKFENQTAETVVSANAKIYGRLHFEVQPQSTHNCLRQLLVGIKGIGPQQLVISQRRVIGKRLEGYMGVDQFQRVYESHVAYPKDFQIIAPNQPGDYELEVCLIELEGEPIENPGTLNGYFQIKAKDLALIEAKDGLNRLWNMNDLGCKVTMGKIRVI